LDLVFVSIDVGFGIKEKAKFCACKKITDEGIVFRGGNKRKMKAVCLIGISKDKTPWHMC